MNVSKTLAAAVLGFVLQGTASAQIYESTDAEGVPEFSDTPSTGAQEVDLSSTNLMGAPATAPAPDEEAGAQAAPSRDRSRQEESVTAGDAYGADQSEEVRARRRLEEQRVDNALHGKGAAGAGEEQHKAKGQR